MEVKDFSSRYATFLLTGKKGTDDPRTSVSPERVGVGNVRTTSDPVLSSNSAVGTKVGSRRRRSRPGPTADVTHDTCGRCGDEMLPLIRRQTSVTFVRPRTQRGSWSPQETPSGRCFDEETVGRWECPDDYLSCA